MNAAQNKEIVSEFFERFSHGEIDAAFEMVSEDVRWWVPGGSFLLGFGLGLEGG